ncbi:MAG: MFS transporter [Dehalococcoidia bacterium]
MTAPAEAPDAPRETGGLFQNPRFISLFIAQALSQLGQSTILFTLLILVLRETDSSLNTSILVFSFIIPSLLFGVVAGLLIDRWNKRRVLVVISVLRGAACAAYILVGDDLLLIYLNTLAFSTFSQFFTPAQISLIPSAVRREHLVSANGIFNFTLMISQFAGLVIVAPFLLISFNADVVFGVVAGFYALAALAGLAVPDAERRREGPAAGPKQLWNRLGDELRRGGELLRGDPEVGLAVGQLTLSATLVLLFSILVPRFLRDVLDLDPDQAVIVFAPTGIGALIGLRALPWFTARLPKQRVTVIGLAGIGICVILLALVEPIGELLAEWKLVDPYRENPERLAGLSILAALSMAIAAPIGLAYALVNSPAQTILHERTPPEIRGQVFATQLSFANVVSILPLLIVGGITDWLGVSVVLVGVGGIIAIAAAISILVERRFIRRREEVGAKAFP